ncbi:MAG: cytochrome c [Chloroflexi bacterium]|nr:cytochrome c [Chloroflexota bacterium]
MKKVLKGIGFVFGSLIGLIILLALGLYMKSRLEFSHTYNVNVESASIPTDATSIDHGKHLATILCMECHSQDLGGDTNWMALGALGGVKAPNLTNGKYGIAGQLSNTDLVRILRHGVKPDGTSVFVMPANDFYHLSDSDLGDLIAYLRSVPSVDRGDDKPDVQMTFIGNVMYGAGVFGNLLRASTIDQTNRPATPQPGISIEYGKYLVNINGCHDCHGVQLSGGKSGDPQSPPAPNLTPGGDLKNWSEADFLKTLRTGSTPSGDLLEPRFMPWPWKGQMTDDELKAIWMYLHSLPPLPTTTSSTG